MKKFFIALSVLAALMLSVVPSQALIGMPDDAPGCDAVVPFICDIDLANPGLNTLIAFTDVLGGFTAGGVNDFHYTIYTVRSDTVYDDWIDGTPRDIVPMNAFEEVGKIAPAIRTQLEVDIDGDGVNDHYAGYIYFQRLVNLVNTVVGQFYLVDLTSGLAACSNIPMKEWGNGIVPAAFNVQMIDQTLQNFGVELFSPNALRAAKDLQLGLAAPTNAAVFGIWPRFYILNANAATWLMFWKSANTIPGILHIDFYDKDENMVSSNIPLDDELTILDIEPYLPIGLFPAATYPKEGFIDMVWATNTAALRRLEILGWTYQQAFGPASESWTVLTPMWRDAF